MNLINTKSKAGLVNLFADFILNKIGKKYDSVIQVTDQNNFLIVNGITNFGEVLDLATIKEEFFERYDIFEDCLENDEKIGIMDLIKYDEDFTKSKNIFWFNLFNSERPIFKNNLHGFIFDSTNIYSVNYNSDYVFNVNSKYSSSFNKFKLSPLCISSEFPHGYSFSMGRLLLYYSEYIATNFLSNSYFDKMEIMISDFKNEMNEQEVNFYIKDSSTSSDLLRNFLLENFDFDLDKFRDSIIDYDFTLDLLEPFEKKPWLLKDKDKERMSFV